MKQWLNQNVDFKRDDAEIRDYKGYGYALTAAGFGAGMLLGLIAFIAQSGLVSPNLEETIANTAGSVLTFGLLAYMIWLILPFLQSSEKTIGDKALMTLFGFVCVIAPFIAGVYIFLLLLIVVFGLGLIYIFLKIMFPGQGKSKSGSSYDKIVSADGSELTGDRIDKDTFSANGTTYKRTYDGLSEVWKEE